MESLKEKPSLLVITSIDNIKSLYDRLNDKYKIYYYPDASLSKLASIRDVDRNLITSIFTNPNKSKIKINKKLIDLFDNLKRVCTASTGTVHIDRDYCDSKNIEIISLTREIDTLKNVSSTAELAFLMVMLSFRNILGATADVKSKNWNCDKFIGRQLDQIKIGIVGFGRLGKMFSNYALAFKAKVFVYDPYTEIKKENKNLIFVNSLKKLVSSVDVFSLHLHVSEETINMINSDILSTCNENIKIINTSRGELINEEDLLDFLKKNQNSMYMTDVIKNEIDNLEISPIYNAYINNEIDNQILITPHIGGMTHDARYIAYHRSVDLLFQSELENDK